MDGDESVQSGVEQSGVDPVRAGVLLGRFRQLGLGEHVVTAMPGSSQPLERRAVAVAGLGGRRVEAGEVDRFRSGGRPGGLDRRRGWRRRGQDALGVARPDVGVTGPGVDPHLAVAGRVRDGDRHLDLDGAAVGQGERCLQGQLADMGAADLVAGADGQLDEPGAGEQHRPGDHVVGQPRHGRG